MRRRNMLCDTGEEFTLEKTSEYIYPSYNSKTYKINLLINGKTPVGKNASNYTITTKTSFCSGATVSSNGTYISYTTPSMYNYGYSSSQKSASITIKYGEQSQTYNVTMYADSVVSSYTTSEISSGNTSGYSSNTLCTNVSWSGNKATYTFVSTNMTCLETVYSNYEFKSGYISKSTKKTNKITNCKASGSCYSTFASLDNLPTEYVNRYGNSSGSISVYDSNNNFLYAYPTRTGSSTYMDGQTHYYFSLFYFYYVIDVGDNNGEAVIMVDSNGNLGITYNWWAD